MVKAIGWPFIFSAVNGTKTNGEIGMTYSEVLPTVQSLPRADKLRLIQVLAAEVACDEEPLPDVSGKAIPIWSPHDSFQGAATLLQALHDEKAAT
jgi:hypothetical protein